MQDSNPLTYGGILIAVILICPFLLGKDFVIDLKDHYSKDMILKIIPFGHRDPRSV